VEAYPDFATKAAVLCWAQVPWSFTFDDERCRDHALDVLDWEIGESYRRWFSGPPPQPA
jgi:hypothetical protein